MARTPGTRGSKTAGRKETGKAPQSMEGLFRALLENSPYVTLLIAPDGTIDYESRPVKSLLGYRPEDRTGVSPFDYLHPEDVARAEAALAEVAGKPSDRVTTELRARHADGSWRTLQVIGQNRLDDPALGHIVVSFRDITELRHREEALLESEARYSVLVEHAKEGVHVVQDGVIKFANPALSEITGYSNQELLGTDLVSLVVSDYQDEVAQRYESRLADDTLPPMMELRIRRKDGTERAIEASGSTIQYEGSPALMGVVRDVTERRRVEEALLDSEEKWRAIVANESMRVLALDRHAKIISINRVSEGRTMEQIAGACAYDHLQPVYQERVREALTSVFQSGETAQYELAVDEPDGSTNWYETSLSPVWRGGEIAEAVSVSLRITRRKLAEENLQRQEQYFRALIENSLDAIAVMNKDGTHSYASPSYERILGRKAEVEVGENALEYVYEDDLPRAADAFARLVRDSGSVMHEEIRVWHGDGSLRTVEVVSRNLLDDPAVQGIVANFRDITLRKEAAEGLRKAHDELERRVEERTLELTEANRALRESEARFRDLANLLPQIVFELDRRGNFIFANRAVLEATGYDQTDVDRGMSAFDTLVPKDRARARRNTKRVLSGERFAGNEYTMVRKDGTTFPVVVYSSPIFENGKPTGIRGIAIDVTESKRLELESRASEQRFKALIENSADVIVIIGDDGRIKYESPAVERVLGYTPEELVGREAFFGLHPDCLSKAAEDFGRMQVDPSVPVQTELMYQHKDGSWRHIEAAGRNLIDDPAVAGIVVNFRDITQRKLAEVRMEESYSQEKELRERLETEMKRRVEFTRALAHELKTPLTAVLASSDLLVSEIEDETLLGLARNIRQGASNLDDRIDELLDLARGEVGMLQLKAEPIDLLQLLREAADRMIPRAVEHGQSIVPALPPKLSTIQADAARLEQVVTNLLDNAIKFTPRGGRITLRARESKGQVTVAVQDTGRGIPKEARERLFEPYQRLDSDRENLSGLGLGLSLSKTLIELHGGTIWVKSRVGRGSTFGFTIPLRAAQQQTQEPEEPRKVWKVLIIEDDREIVDFVALNFRLRWPEAELVSTGLGDEGVEMVESEDPNVVILDLGLPDISGFEVLRQIRLFSSVPVIILTVRGDEADMVKGLEWGADDYVVKPFRQSELLARLKVQLRKKTLPDEDAPIVCGSLRLDPSTFQLTHGAEEISLTIVEGRIIEHLMRNAGHVVTHASLAEAVWGEDYPGAIESLRVYIRYIRQKLEADPGHPKLILTKAGVGYSLARPT